MKAPEPTNVPLKVSAPFVISKDSEPRFTVPVPANDPNVTRDAPETPETSSVPLTASLLVGARLPLPDSFKTPAETVVVPVYVLMPVRISVPPLI